MRNLIRCISMLTLFCIIVPALATQEIRVVASIKPLAGLVKAVAGDKVQLTQLVPDNVSPHAFQLKPSDVLQLERANLVIWIDPSMEPFLVKSLQQRPAISVPILAFPLPQRIAARTKHTHADGEHDHHHGHIDPHVWLSPTNAQEILRLIAKQLSEVDPANQHYYQTNAASMIEKIAALQVQLTQELKPWKQTHYYVFHDAYQYFESSFDLQPARSITTHPEVPLSGNALLRIRQDIAELGITCLFTEPEFSSHTLQSALSELHIVVSELDPLGARVPLDKEHYLHLLRNMANQMQGCFSQK